MDYKELLKKYIRHVGDLEGVSFLGPQDKSKFFSDSEWEELIKIDDEVAAEISRQWVKT